MNEIKTVGVTQTAHRSLLPDADSVITVDKGRGFIIEHRALFDFGDGFRRLRRKLVVTLFAPRSQDALLFVSGSYLRKSARATGGTAQCVGRVFVL
jgi:hypothetical protein